MIHKIELINSIGKFRNYQAQGDVTFRKLTLIYADNGSGKTTLASIFRSLGLNSPTILIPRTSTNSTTPQRAQIRQRDSEGNNIYHTLRNTGWTNTLPEIEVFDIHFINNNIHSGFVISDEHKKKLHQFVLGAQGVTLQNQIETNKADKTASRQVINTIEAQIISGVGNELTSELLQEFIDLDESEATDIATRITSAEVELANSRANSLIQTLQLLETLKLIPDPINYEETITDMQTDLEIIDDVVLNNLYSSHCEMLESNNLTEPENWLKKGYDYYSTSNDNPSESDEQFLKCPFCKQSIDENLEIIKAYSIKFNVTLNELIDRMQIKKQSLSNYNFDLILNNLLKTLRTNFSIYSAWRDYTTIDPLSENIIPDHILLSQKYKDLVESINAKCGNPSKSVNSLSINAFRNSISEVNEIINSYNETIIRCNDQIRLLKDSVRSEADALSVLNRLKRIQKRYDQNIDTLCNNLIVERANLRRLERDYSQLVVQQETTAQTFFTLYGNRINHYLGNNVFRTPFRISDVEHTRPRGRALQSKLSYVLTIDGHPISFDNSNSLCVRDCLSEGDKSTIALSFFLAKLDIDANLTNKILVFDDPLSSLDSNRRFNTVRQLRNLLQRINQAIVMSHNDRFLYELYKEVAPSDKKTLRITENFLTNESTIEPLDLDSLVELDYYKHIKELEEFIRHSDISKKERILGLLRNILEAHIQFKFYRQLAGIPSSRRTFGTLITELINQNVVFRDNTNADDIIEKLRLINAISCKPHHGEPIPDYSSIGVDPATISIAELVGFVSDTLSLIDDRL